MRFLTLIFLTLSTIFANSLELDGVVVSQNEKIISSKMMGFITKVYFNEGDMVKKGQILYEIDATDLAYNSEILRNQIKNLELNLKRYKDLLNQDLVSKFDYEQLELNLTTAKAKQSELNANFNYLKIKAPNSGVVVKKSIKEGEMAMPGMPHLILTDLDDLVIKANISESSLKDIKIGKKVDIEISSQNFKNKGEIVAIYPNYIENAHSFVIKIAFNKEDFNIFPAMYSKITIDLDEK